MMLLSLLLAAAPTIQIQATVDGAKAKPGWVYARVGQQVELHAVAKDAHEFRWFRVEPTVQSVDNTQPSFHFADITFEETEIEACRDKQDCPADVASTKYSNVPQLAGAGTMAFKLTATSKDGKPLATPGRESMKWGGLTTEVFRVIVRKDDTLIGYASELINTPYIFGSAGPDGRNQTDLLIGSDCADLAVYARRRSGIKTEYTSSYAIDQQAPEVKGPARVGDLIHFPSMRHVAILFEDHDPKGVVTEDDLILHTCWAPPTAQRIGDTSCVAPPYRVLRFPSAR
jgi:cell wall-associated NlpC family hydrolase